MYQGAFNNIVVLYSRKYSATYTIGSPEVQFCLVYVMSRIVASHLSRKCGSRNVFPWIGLSSTGRNSLVSYLKGNNVIAAKLLLYWEDWHRAARCCWKWHTLSLTCWVIILARAAMGLHWCFLLLDPQGSLPVGPDECVAPSASRPHHRNWEQWETSFAGCKQALTFLSTFGP